MDNERTLKYYNLLEEMLTLTTNPKCFDVEKIYANLTKLCKLFRLSKGQTEFYQTIAREKNGNGNVYVCYDSGEKSHAVIEKRIVTKSMAVVKISVYMADNEPPLTPLEEKRITLVMMTILRFVSHNRLQDVVERFAYHDDAGYPNLRAFIRYIENLSQSSSLYGYTAVHFNLRHFTLINQEIGRNAGDIVMRGYFSMFENIIGDKGLVCRVGGDNFVALFSNELIDSVIQVIRGVPVVYDVNSGKRIMISSSAGVFVIPEDFVSESSDDVMTYIIPCSQMAKNGGKDSIVFYDESLAENKEKRMRIQQLFPEAIANGEFKVFYQPKIDVSTGELSGAEALCRWFRDGGIIPPLEFIPVLEQNTDICKLDFYMLDHVCADIRRWLDEGRNVVRVSVNLSRKHMMDVDLLEHILEIVDRHNIPHKYIEVELTETNTDVEFRDIKRVVSGLQQAGIYTSVDDFGMGYSSLNLIREVPWNVLKVDKSFLPVDDDSADSTRSVMFKYVVAMAKELGLECIAEGVETQRQVNILRENDCIFAQGFFFDKPLPIDQFEERLSSHHYNLSEI